MRKKSDIWIWKNGWVDLKCNRIQGKLYPQTSRITAVRSVYSYVASECNCWRNGGRTGPDKTLAHHDAQPDFTGTTDLRIIYSPLQIALKQAEVCFTWVGLPDVPFSRTVVVFKLKKKSLSIIMLSGLSFVLVFVFPLKWKLIIFDLSPYNFRLTENCFTQFKTAK